MDHSVPSINQLNEIYSDLQVQSQNLRYKKLIKEFQKQFNVTPHFISRAPGRVNIIGEHIDYCGFGVLPMGIEKDILGAVYVEDKEVEAGEEGLEISNINPKYRKATIKLLSKEEGLVNVDMEKHEWYNYCLAGYKGVLETKPNNKVRKIKIMIDGTVPAGSGLSSSSALVVCMSLATSYSQDIPLKQKELAKLCVNSERYVGVNGGGMDQTCSILARKNALLNIEFIPTLNARLVKLPNLTPECVFVIANSNIVADKQKSARYHYNLRVVETRMVAYLLASYLKLDIDLSEAPTLKTVLDAYYKNNSNISNLDKLTQFLKLTKEHINKEPYTVESFSKDSRLALEKVEQLFFTKYDVDRTKFELYKRANHVFSEALRVYQYCELCESSSPDVASKLGNLMNESQASCNLLFDCSCPELTQLTQLALQYGALGSRLTGAGWGGATVSLVPVEKVDEFIKGLRNSYFKKYTDEQFNEFVFPTSPSMGAVLLNNLGQFLSSTKLGNKL